MAHTDFNDLQIAEGRDEVRRQLMAALEAPPQAPAPPEDFEGGQLTLETALERFALAMPDAKVWDAHKRRLLAQRAAKALMGELWPHWLTDNARRTVEQADVAVLQAVAQKEGVGGLAQALSRYVYLYPSDTVWDRAKRKVVAIKDLRHAIAADFDAWIKHPQRVNVDIENLVFDPTQKADTSTHINMFRGLPLKPVRDADKCQNIRMLVNLLCNEEPTVFDWLMRWLAYPLQHVGAKMDTAIMMHSDQQGSGKSLLFDGIIRKIYGEYGATLGQHQLESQYTDWRSNILFGLFEEVLSRDQKYSHTGTVKHMITGETHRIEKKFVSGWEESNHLNAVFLSNEVQPFPVEETDRRMMVIWPERRLSAEMQKAVADEIKNGGIEAFYGWLLKLPMGDFNRHTKPLMTEAKERLIDFGRPGWDSFYREWKRGALDVPFSSCLSHDLFQVYRSWCHRDNEKIVTHTRFAGFIASKNDVRRRRDLHYTDGYSSRKGTFFVVGRAPDGRNQQDWLGDCVQEFRKCMPSGNTGGAD